MLRMVALLALIMGLVWFVAQEDPVTWQSTGFVVEAATKNLEEEHGVEEPVVECIHYDSGEALWHCRAHTGTQAFKCHLFTGPREVVHEVECERIEETSEPAHETG